MTTFGELADRLELLVPGTVLAQKLRAREDSGDGQLRVSINDLDELAWTIEQAQEVKRENLVARIHGLFLEDRRPDAEQERLQRVTHDEMVLWQSKGKDPSQTQRMV